MTMKQGTRLCRAVPISYTGASSDGSITHQTPPNLFHVHVLLIWKISWCNMFRNYGFISMKMWNCKEHIGKEGYLNLEFYSISFWSYTTHIYTCIHMYLLDCIFLLDSGHSRCQTYWDGQRRNNFQECEFPLWTNVRQNVALK